MMRSPTRSSPDVLSTLNVDNTSHHSRVMITANTTSCSHHHCHNHYNIVNTITITTGSTKPLGIPMSKNLGQLSTLKSWRRHRFICGSCPWTLLGDFPPSDHFRPHAWKKSRRCPCWRHSLQRQRLTTHGVTGARICCARLDHNKNEAKIWIMNDQHAYITCLHLKPNLIWINQSATPQFCS